jgi:DNA-binding transcriptional LysR family regulator
VRFASVSSALAAFVTPAAVRLRAEQPRLHVHLSEEESKDVFALLLAHRTDIAVLLPTSDAPPPGDPRFDQQPLLDEPQDLLVPPGHRLAAQGGAELAEAAGEPWIGAPDRPDQHHLMLSSCAAAGFAPRIAHHAYEWFAVSALVAAGFGVSLVPRLAPLPPEHEVVRVPLRGEPVPSRRIITCVRRGSDRQPPIAHGLAALREAVAAYGKAHG